MAIAVAKSYTKGIKKLYAKPGIFRGGIIDGNVKIDNKNITLMDTEITGDLILGEGIGDGDVRLHNVKVKGETIVKGGGEDSIIIENCEFTKIIIVKEDGKIRVLVKGNTTIDETEVQSGAKLETDKVTGEGFGYVTLAEGLEGDTLIELIGNFEDIEIQAEGVQIQASGGTIGNLTIAKGAKDLDINLAKNSKVTILSAQESVVVKGEGIVDKVDAPKGVKVEVPKKETHTPTTRGGGGSGRGGSGGEDAPSTIAVSAISVEGDAVAGSTLTAKTTPTKATGNYQWFRADEKGEYTEIDDAAAKTYTLTNEDVGSYIKVTIKGTGSYKGTATSDPSEKVVRPVKSTYKFIYEIPEGDVVAGVPVELPITTKYDILGDEDYDSVLIKVEGKSTEGDAGVTFKITAHGIENEHTFVGSGQWGPPEGWKLPADFNSTNTWTLIFPEAGDYTISFWLEDLDTGNKIVESSEEVTVRDKEHSEYGFLIGEEYQVPTVLKVDGLIAGDFVSVSGDENVTEPGEITDNALEALATALGGSYGKEDLQKRLVDVVLKATDIKELDYDKVRILPLEIEKTHGVENGDMQVWLYASQHDKKWWNIAETGWGSEETGFKLDPGENSLMKAYVFGTSPGIYKITFKAVDISNPNEDEFIATGTAEVIVKAGVSVNALEKSHYEAGDPIEFTISGLEHNKTVEMTMKIYLGGGGYSWADEEPAELTTMERGEGDKKGRWFGTADENGVLIVSGIVQPDLPSGELRITLPDYGYYLEQAIPLQDNHGAGVRVGDSD